MKIQKHLTLRTQSFLTVCFFLLIFRVQGTPLSSAVTYTIDSSQAASATNFKNFNSAVTYLMGSAARSDGGISNTAPFGVSGPIVFNVAAGTFPEQVLISGAIDGASSTNTVTFDGGNGNAATRMVTYAATVSGSRFTFQLNNVQYVRLRNLTITTTGTTYGWGIHLTGSNSSNNFVKNCIINVSGIGTTSTSANNCAGIVISGSNTNTESATNSNNLEIDSNTVNYGYYGIACTGPDATKGMNNKFRNNIINNAYKRGFHLSTQDGIVIERNQISLRSAAAPPASSSAIYCYNFIANSGRNVINANRITSNIGTYGIYFNSCGNNPGPKGIICNNIIGGDFKLTTGNCIYMTGSNDWIITQNTLDLNIDGTAQTDAALNISFGCTGLEVINNIISNSKPGIGLAMYIAEPGYFQAIDYNIYYKAGFLKPLMNFEGIVYTGDKYRGVSGYNNNSASGAPGLNKSGNMHITNACTNGSGLASYISNPTLSLCLSQDVDGDTRNTTSPDIGADEYMAFANDLEVMAVVSPVSPSISGLQDLVVKVRNNGSTPIGAFNLSYIHNGGTAKTFVWSGFLNPCQTESIVFTGTDKINIGTTNTLVVYSELSGDNNLSNDTLNTTILPGMSGNYTIGATASDYTSFTAAVTDLKLKGITGPVVFTVTAGTYTGQVSLNEQISGASSINTITFDGVSASTRIVNYSSTASGSRHTFFVGSNYIILRNLTIRASGTYGWPVNISGSNLVGIKIKNCIVDYANGGITATSQNFSAVVINGSATSATGGARIDSLEIDSNSIKYGYYGIVCVGLSGNASIGNKFRNNIIDSSYNTALYIQNQTGVDVQYNFINRKAASNGAEGIRLSAVGSSTTYRTIINGNKIRNKSGSGIYIENCSNVLGRKGICTNNIIGGDIRKASTYGIQVTGSSFWFVCHNTIVNDFPDGTSNQYAGFTAGTSNNITVLNNVFTVTAASQSLPLYADNAFTFDTLDYNQFYKADTANHELLYVGTLLNGGTFRGMWNTHSIVKPFKYISATDLHIIETCNNGIDISAVHTDSVLLSLVSKDMDGNSRTGAPDMGAYELTPLSKDLSVTGILSPDLSSPFAPGSKDLVIGLQNNGATTITAFTLKYNNNGTIVSETWAGSLGQCDTTSIVFTGAKQLNLSVVSNLSVYIELAGDLYRNNDTIKTVFTPGLSGAYTIGATGNYTSFSAAANALKAGGVLAPVTFTVSPGTYSEQVNLGDQIRGASGTNTITFDGVDSATRILDFSATASALRYTLWVGSSYVRIKNLTIRASGTTYGWPVFLSSKTPLNDIRFTKCKIEITSSAGQAAATENFIGFVISSSVTSSSNSMKADSLVIDSNTFNYGLKGIAGYGAFESADWSTNCRVRNNVFNSHNNNGIDLSNYKNLWVQNNTITISKTSAFGSGITLSGMDAVPGDRIVVTGNTIYNTGNGGTAISIYQCNNSSPLSKGIVANNMISGFKHANAYGININQSINWNICHNSVNNNITGGTSADQGNPFWANSFDITPSNLSVFNNIFAVSKNSASLPLYVSNGANLFDTLDYNIYYRSDTSNGQFIKLDQTIYSPLNFAGAAGLNAHSFFKLPGFINDTNLHLPQQNACANRSGLIATNLAITNYTSTDIDGETRVNPPLIGADEIVAPYNFDLAVTGLLSPTVPILSGSQTLTVKLTNIGNQTIFWAPISYSVNNGTPITETWTGNLQKCDTASITFVTPISIGAGTNAIKVYSETPNGVADDNTSNDTLTFQAKTAMAGVYTIGSVVTDSFADFTTAIQALNQRGVSGSVLFNVRTGNYTDHIEITQNIPGSSMANTITFQGLHRDSAILNFNATGANTSTVNILDASYLTFKKLSFNQLNTTNYNALTITGKCSYTTFEDCRLTTTVPTVNLNYAIYGNNLSGAFLTFKNNLISGGGGGVYLRGVSPSQKYNNLTFDRNTIQTTFFATYDIRNIDTLLLTNCYIYLNGTRVNNNNYLTACNNSIFANNVIIGTDFVNEPQLVFFDGSLNSALYHNSFNLRNDNGNGVYLYNLPVNGTKIKNNIFTSRGSSYAVTYNNAPVPAMGSVTEVDYNSYYSTGSIIHQVNPNTTYANLTAWKTALSNQDLNSVNYRPGYTSNTNLAPAISDSASWSLNGRGLHLGLENVYGATLIANDINGNPRPATYADGAPDLGAFEFTPTSTPPEATALPATPAPGTTQVFLFANDTIAKISWDVFSAVPATIRLRQYSGQKPANIPAFATDYMNFSVSADFSPGAYIYTTTIPYKEGWKGTLPNENNAQLITYKPSAPWTLETASMVDSSKNFFTGNFTSNWSVFTGTNLFNPLPVKFTGLKATNLKAGVALDWSTATEMNNNGFEIERSENPSGNWKVVGFVKALKQVSTNNNYRFVDPQPFHSTISTLYYRLKQIDFNGEYAYSSIVWVNSKPDIGSQFTVFPNPFNTNVSVRISSLHNSTITVRLSDITGRTISTSMHEMIAGTNDLEITNAHTLQSGIYFISIEQDGVIHTRKLVKE